MDKTFFDKVCVELKHNYEKIFEQIYPAKNSSGFTERNLSVNFAKAYEKIVTQQNQNCITWYEFQFGDKNNQHYDAVIINITTKEILIIEAKRYNDLPKKIYSTINDISRINNFPTEILNENSRRIADFNLYKIYGVVLADVWTAETSSPKLKTAIIAQYLSQNFIKTNNHIQKFINEYWSNEEKFNLDNLEIIYNVQGFNDCLNLNHPIICNHYFLLSMIWELAV